MMNDVPLVSVVVPTFNGARYVESALACLQSQSYPNLEIVVVDDGSTDDTTDIVDRLASEDRRLILVRTRHGGIAATRNEGLMRATGELVTFLDQDDLCPRGKIERHVAYLVREPDIMALFGTTIIFTSDQSDPTIAAQSGRSPTFTMCLSAALFHRSVFDRIGLFNPKFKLADDLDFILRLVETNLNIWLESHVATLHRRHPAQATSDLAATRRDATVALAESLKRRRASGNLRDLRHPLLTSIAR